MTPYQVKAMQIASRIRKLMREKLDDNNVMGMIRLLNRWNAVHNAAFSGESYWTAGNMLDAYIEERIFESKC